MLTWIGGTAFALTCDTPDTTLALTTPDVVPPNAELVVTYTAPAPPVGALTDPDGLELQATVEVEAGHLTILPDGDLQPGPHTLTVGGQAFPFEVDGAADTSPPLPPTVDSATREATDSDEWGDPLDQTTIRLRTVPAGSHVELELTPDDGSEPLIAATDERLFKVGYRFCDDNWPAGFDVDLRYAFRIRSVDAAGKPSSWMPVIVSNVDPEGETSGCQTAPTPVVLEWLGRRRRGDGR